MNMKQLQKLRKISDDMSKLRSDFIILLAHANPIEATAAMLIYSDLTNVTSGIARLTEAIEATEKQ